MVRPIASQLALGMQSGRSSVAKLTGKLGVPTLAWSLSQRMKNFPPAKSAESEGSGLQVGVPPAVILVSSVATASSEAAPHLVSVVASSVPIEAEAAVPDSLVEPVELSIGTNVEEPDDITAEVEDVRATGHDEALFAVVADVSHDADDTNEMAMTEVSEEFEDGEEAEEAETRDVSFEEFCAGRAMASDAEIVAAFFEAASDPHAATADADSELSSDEGEQ